VVPEAPQISAAQTRPDIAAPQSGLPTPGPPPAQPPKVTFERPGTVSGAPVGGGLGRGQVPRPAGTVAEAVREAVRPAGKGLIVGDEDPAPGSNPSAAAVPVPGKLGSSVELLSDPQGVDFWPYMMRVLTAVRRNWFAVIPESARFGRQGRTTIQFAIDRNGTVPKLVIATPSGTEALDRAAVASVSASNPFPPLPGEFKGSQIRLQFVFKYNVR
ncbi:MAG TPA: TonB family protein, partial [Bryobacteraceae bacterium]|nr:TonB family protein [Bryobacteraceae bacterium]